MAILIISEMLMLFTSGKCEEIILKDVLNECSKQLGQEFAHERVCLCKRRAVVRTREYFDEKQQDQGKSNVFIREKVAIAIIIWTEWFIFG